MTDEGEAFLNANGVTAADAGPKTSDGKLLAASLHIQCMACLERGEETVIPFEITNAMNLDEMDFSVICPVCTEHNKHQTVILFDVITGDEVEEHEDALDAYQAQLAARAGELNQLPFDGVAPTVESVHALDKGPK